MLYPELLFLSEPTNASLTAVNAYPPEALNFYLCREQNPPIYLLL